MQQWQDCNSKLNVRRIQWLMLLFYKLVQNPSDNLSDCMMLSKKCLFLHKQHTILQSTVSHQHHEKQAAPILSSIQYHHVFIFLFAPQGHTIQVYNVPHSVVPVNKQFACLVLLIWSICSKTLYHTTLYYTVTAIQTMSTAIYLGPNTQGSFSQPIAIYIFSQQLVVAGGSNRSHA